MVLKNHWIFRALQQPRGIGPFCFSCRYHFSLQPQPGTFGYWHHEVQPVPCPLRPPLPGWHCQLSPSQARGPRELSQTLPATCQLPPARGPCRGLFYWYFYDNMSSECEHFAYGGCQGADNNLETTEICLRICKHAETR
ncbi:kunitz-type protease inhibitor 3 [Leptonychotes weddellii]|uniref:Kunitz-type protease inhibitor 3 n=1 Tax=Leptonychotes weddellii TaxID=9713 RepID=A0A7F8QXZ0_LEPWE|nr:kunitz-type protease inhibitor 3 [Leptonychotes weddellii]